MFTGRKLPLTLAFTVLVALATGVSCKGFFTSPTVTAITIGPTGQTLPPGGQLQMVASGTMSDGSPNQIVTNKCLWSSTNSAAATIGANTGLAVAPTTIVSPPQQTNITAAYQALTPATATLSACPSLTSLTISASPLSFPSGTATTITFTAIAVFSTGGGNQNVVDEVSWNIGNTNIVPSISGGTAVTSGDGTTGTTTVTATLCGFPSNVLTLTATP